MLGTRHCEMGFESKTNAENSDPCFYVENMIAFLLDHNWRKYKVISGNIDSTLGIPLLFLNFLYINVR